MLPIKTILCPTDFSEPSYEALATAGELAVHFGAELFLLHVVSPVPTVAANVGPTAFNINTYQLELETDAKNMLARVIKDRVPEEIAVHPVVLSGNAAEKILKTATEKGNISLIVISSNGKTGWRNVLFGSVAEKVVRLSQIPVLTISGKKER